MVPNTRPKISSGNRLQPRLTAQVHTPMINVHRRNEPSCAPQVALIR